MSHCWCLRRLPRWMVGSEDKLPNGYKALEIDGRQMMVHEACVFCNGVGTLSETRKKRMGSEYSRRLKNRRVSVWYNGELLHLSFKRLAVVDGRRMVLAQSVKLSPEAAFAMFQGLGALFTGDYCAPGDLSPHMREVLSIPEFKIELSLGDMQVARRHIVEHLHAQACKVLDGQTDDELLKELGATQEAAQ